ETLFTVEVPTNPMATIDWMKIEGAEPIGKDGDLWTYKLSSIQEIVNAEIEYQVPAMGLEHVVSFRFKLEGLDSLPEKAEPETPEEEPETPEETPETPEENPEAPEETPETPEENPEAPEETPETPEEQ